MLMQNIISVAIDSFSKIINLDTSTINICFDNNGLLDYMAMTIPHDNTIRFNLCKIVSYIFYTKKLESEDEIRAFILRIVGHELCHIKQLMVGNIEKIETDCDIHTIKLIENNKQYFISTYGRIDTHKFSDMQYMEDNYKEKQHA